MPQTQSRDRPLKILLVENSKTSCAIVLGQLQAQGYVADSVRSGKEAIEAILVNDYFLVIMDIFLPEMNGYEATQRIRALKNDRANIPIIALTSSTEEMDKNKCFEAGMNAYIVKSDDNAELYRVIQQYL